MYCKQCGNELQDGSAFCNKCGTNLEEKKNLANSKKFAISKKMIIPIIILTILIPLSYLTYNYVKHQPPKNVSKEVYNGSIQWSSFFEEHKKNNFQNVSQSDLDKFTEFIKKYQNNATQEEQKILDKSEEIMFAYGLEANGYSNAKGENSFDNKVLELKKLLNLK